jgi:glycosyltransferase involved in cell wall biosynthesis
VKIAFLADAPYVHTRRWVGHFVAAGHECHVITFRPAEIPGARVHDVDGAEVIGKARYLVHARRVKALVRSLEPDLVHALHLTSYGFLGALAGVHPLLTSVWGTDVLEAPSLTPLHRWLTRYSLARADAITATGLHLATETTRWAPRGKPVTVVPYGVDLDRFASKWANGQTGKEHGRPVVVGTAARLSPEKGLTYLIDAFALLRRRYGEGVTLRIAGEGPERARLEEQVARLGLGGAIEFTGWLEHGALPAFLHSLDVFAMPSTWEGFGVAAAEASACGLPVVATDVYGIPDVVRPNLTGLLVPPKDPQSLADALGRLVEDAPLREKLGTAGHEYVASHYDWRDNAKQMESIYESLVSRSTLPGAAS